MPVSRTPTPSEPARVGDGLEQLVGRGPVDRRRGFDAVRAAVGAEAEVSRRRGRCRSPAGAARWPCCGSLDRERRRPGHPLDQAGDEIGVDVLDDQHRRREPGRGREKIGRQRAGATGRGRDRRTTGPASLIAASSAWSGRARRTGSAAARSALITVHVADHELGLVAPESGLEARLSTAPAWADLQSAPATRASTADGDVPSSHRADSTRIGVGVLAMICSIACWPAAVGDVEVEGDDVGPERGDHCDRFGGACRLADDVDVAVGLEDGDELAALRPSPRPRPHARITLPPAALLMRALRAGGSTAASRLASSKPLLTM